MRNFREKEVKKRGEINNKRREEKETQINENKNLHVHLNESTLIQINTQLKNS